MKKSRYTDNQIPSILTQAEAGTPVPELCREHGMSSAAFYKWRAKYGGMDASMMSRLKELEDENRRLKNMYANERLKAVVACRGVAAVKLACAAFSISEACYFLYLQASHLTVLSA